MCANTPRTPCRPGASWIGFARSPGRTRWAMRGRTTRSGSASAGAQTAPATIAVCAAGGTGRTRSRRIRAAIDFDAGAQGTHAGGKDARDAAPLQRADRAADEGRTEEAEKAEKAPAHGDPAAGVCRAAAGGGALGRALRAEPVCRGQAGSRPCGGREGAVCADRPILAGRVRRGGGHGRGGAEDHRRPDERGHGFGLRAGGEKRAAELSATRQERKRRSSRAPSWPSRAAIPTRRRRF